MSSVRFQIDWKIQLDDPWKSREPANHHQVTLRIDGLAGDPLYPSPASRPAWSPTLITFFVPRNRSIYSPTTKLAGIRVDNLLAIGETGDKCQHSIKIGPALALLSELASIDQKEAEIEYFPTTKSVGIRVDALLEIGETGDKRQYSIKIGPALALLRKLVSIGQEGAEIAFEFADTYSYVGSPKEYVSYNFNFETKLFNEKQIPLTGTKITIKLPDPSGLTGQIKKWISSHVPAISDRIQYYSITLEGSDGGWQKNEKDGTVTCNKPVPSSETIRFQFASPFELLFTTLVKIIKDSVKVLAG
jgi:hypothetical protein